MGHSGLFFVFSIFICTIGRYNFADDWIRTVDLWCQKQPLNQLSHNNCHKYILLHFKTIDSHSHQLHMPSCQQKKILLLKPKWQKVTSVRWTHRDEEAKKLFYFFQRHFILFTIVGKCDTAWGRWQRNAEGFQVDGIFIATIVVVDVDFDDVGHRNSSQKFRKIFGRSRNETKWKVVRWRE